MTWRETSSRRFLVSYGKQVNTEGIQYSDGTIHINDSWVPSEYEDIDKLKKVLSQKGKNEVVITWIDEEVE